MKGCRKTIMQKLQDCRKTKRYVLRVPHCSRAFCGILATALRYSARLHCSSLAADVRQMRGWRTITLIAAVLRQPCVSWGCRTSLRKHKQIAKKMNMSKIRCGSLATLFFVRQSCGVVNNTVRLPYETKKFAVADRCTAAARLM